MYEVTNHDMLIESYTNNDMLIESYTNHDMLMESYTIDDVISIWLACCCFFTKRCHCIMCLM